MHDKRLCTCLSTFMASKDLLHQAGQASATLVTLRHKTLHGGLSFYQGVRRVVPKALVLREYPSYPLKCW